MKKRVKRIKSNESLKEKLPELTSFFKSAMRNTIGVHSAKHVKEEEIELKIVEVAKNYQEFGDQPFHKSVS